MILIKKMNFLRIKKSLGVHLKSVWIVLYEDDGPMKTVPLPCESPIEHTGYRYTDIHTQIQNMFTDCIRVRWYSVSDIFFLNFRLLKIVNVQMDPRVYYLNVFTWNPNLLIRFLIAFWIRIRITIIGIKRSRVLYNLLYLSFNLISSSSLVELSYKSFRFIGLENKS